jgi:hypothetical protein
MNLPQKTSPETVKEEQSRPQVPSTAAVKNVVEYVTCVKELKVEVAMCQLTETESQSLNGYQLRDERPESVEECQSTKPGQ